MGFKLLHLHLHGLFRSQELELGRDADTGGQTLYVLELARGLAARPEVERVEVVTRLKPQENTKLEGLYKSSGNFCTQCEGCSTMMAQVLRTN